MENATKTVENMDELLKEIEEYELKTHDSCMTLELYSDGSGRLLKGSGATAFAFDDSQDFKHKILNL